MSYESEVEKEEAEFVAYVETLKKEVGNGNRDKVGSCDE